MSVVISTEGGSVQDMFAAYDCMRDVKEHDIETIGLGKVMSAGVLLLASEQKGKRRVGRNCRLMLHSISGGNFGSLKELQVDLKKLSGINPDTLKLWPKKQICQNQRSEVFSEEKTDTYFDAEQLPGELLMKLFDDVTRFLINIKQPLSDDRRNMMQLEAADVELSDETIPSNTIVCNGIPVEIKWDKVVKHTDVEGMVLPENCYKTVKNERMPTMFVHTGMCVFHPKVALMC